LKKNTLIFITFLFILSCREEEGNPTANQAPETTFSIEEFNLSGDSRLNSIVRLSWYGKDPDGYVVGYEISQDGSNWFYTTQTDSTFQFSLNSGSDTADIQLFVRALDNLDLADPSPDCVRIPIKNSPPEIEFDDDLNFPDTAYLVATAEWRANDLDGIETITNVQISLNGKAWFDLNRTKSVFSLVPISSSNSDTVQAQVYYDTDPNPDAELIEGLILNDTNQVFIRAIDQAGIASEIDTASTFYMRGKTNDLVVIGGIDGLLDGKTINDYYAELLRSANISYDFVDYGKNNGEAQPKLWNTTFRLMINQYDKLLLYSDETLYINDYTNIKSLILDFAATSLQDFSNKGGK
jgi:hypothetical protein